MRNEPIETVEYKGFTIQVLQDEYPEDPREWSNLGKMICFHKRYNLGDKHDLKSDNFSGWQEIYDYLKKEYDAFIILPLFLYDHSGITMSCSRNYPYNDVWDAGQVGFIYMTKKQIIDELGRPKPTKKNQYAFTKIKHITKADIEHATKYLEGEVETYDQFLTGEVYGYNIVDPEGEDKDSCWGYFGYSEGRKDMIEEAKNLIESYIEDRAEERAEATEIEVGKLALT